MDAKRKKALELIEVWMKEEAKRIEAEEEFRKEGNDDEKKIGTQKNEN